IAWQSQNQDESGYGVYAQRYDSNGGKQGSEFLVNTETSRSQSFPSVGMDSDGDFSFFFRAMVKMGVLWVCMHSAMTAMGGNRAASSWSIQRRAVVRVVQV
ncbi:MAG: hypothetical protein AB8B69_06645, partial [Chitinophagales bacterium]